MTTEPTVTSVISVLPVMDHESAVSWYTAWIGRRPDVEPAEGVAEWQVAQNAWLQVSVDPGPAGSTTVVVGVADIDAQRAACDAAGIVCGEVVDYGVVKTTEALDPAGNKIVFAQEVSRSDDPGSMTRNIPG